jgi:hypothetical protein
VVGDVVHRDVPPETTLGREVLVLGADEDPELPVLPDVLVLPESPVLPVLLLEEPCVDEELPVEPVEVEERELVEPEVPAEPLAAPGCSRATRMPKATVAPAAVSTVAFVTTLRRARTWSLVAGVFAWLVRDMAVGCPSLCGSAIPPPEHRHRRKTRCGPPVDRARAPCTEGRTGASE